MQLSKSSKLSLSCRRKSSVFVSTRQISEVCGRLSSGKLTSASEKKHMKGLFEPELCEASDCSLVEADFEPDPSTAAPQSMQKASLGKNLRPQLVQSIFGGSRVGRRQFSDGLHAENAIVATFASHLDIFQVILLKRLVIKWVVGWVPEPVRRRVRLDKTRIRPL